MYGLHITIFHRSVAFAMQRLFEVTSCSDASFELHVPLTCTAECISVALNLLQLAAEVMAGAGPA